MKNTKQSSGFATNTIYVLALLLFINTCQQIEAAPTIKTASQSTYDINTHTGWLHNNCLAIKNNTLSKNDKVTIVSFAQEQQILSSIINKKAESATDCPALLADRKKINISAGYSFYLIKQTREKIDLAIGLVNNPAKLIKLNGQVSGDVNGDGKPEYFTQCSSSEGLHFSIWTEKPDSGEPLWSGYYYLGYDIEPNCPQ